MEDSKYARVSTIKAAHDDHPHAEPDIVNSKETDRLHRLSEDTDTTLLEHGDLASSPRRRRTQLGPLWLWVLHVALLFTSIMFFVLGATMGPTTRAFVEKFSTYSPALNSVEFQTVTFNNTKGAKTPFVGAGPGPDKAWEHITLHMGDQMVSAGELAMLGKPQNRLRVTDEKTGESGFRMELAVVHQLHCLNLMRKYVHKDHYEPLGGDLAVPEAKLMGHLSKFNLSTALWGHALTVADHCIEALRLKVMCEADTGVILYQEQPGSDGKLEPDYETQHVCRNFDKVRQWAVDNTVAAKVTF